MPEAEVPFKIVPPASHENFVNKTLRGVNITDAEEEAIDIYKGAGAFKTNSKLRAGVELTDKEKELVSLMDSAGEKTILKNRVMVSRGVKSKRIEALVGNCPVICSNNSGVAEIGTVILPLDKEIKIKMMNKYKPPEIDSKIVFEALDRVLFDDFKWKINPNILIENAAKNYYKALK